MLCRIAAYKEMQPVFMRHTSFLRLLKLLLASVCFFPLYKEVAISFLISIKEARTS